MSLEPQDVFRKLARNVETVMRGQSGAIRRLLAAFASGGHVLLEDYPGTGKTTLAKALARSIGGRFKRIQFTPDLLPSDILGVSVFDQRDHAFHICNPDYVKALVMIGTEWGIEYVDGTMEGAERGPTVM